MDTEDSSLKKTAKLLFEIVNIYNDNALKTGFHLWMYITNLDSHYEICIDFAFYVVFFFQIKITIGR